MTDEETERRKRGAKATHAGLADLDRRDEARQQMAAVNRIDTRDWRCLLQRRDAVRKALEAA